MTDTHIRILRLIAQQRRRDLSDHDAADRSGEAAAEPRRRHLERAATRTRMQAAQAEARRGPVGITPVCITPPTQTRP
jgi:hypothetical protein